jgi:C4-type Zn-finger protein
MRDCPQCNAKGALIKIRVPIVIRGKHLYESVWECQECGYTEDVEPDWDSIKGGPDHE